MELVVFTFWKMDLYTDKYTSGECCPYCESKTEVVTGWDIYIETNRKGYADPGVQHKIFTVCFECRAWVGHHSTGEPFGGVADGTDRLLRRKAHSLFDPLWKIKMKVTGKPKHECRSAAYNWLAEVLRISPEECHISQMWAERLEAVIIACERAHEQIKRKQESKKVRQDIADIFAQYGIKDEYLNP